MIGASWSASHQRPASKFRLPSIFSRSASSDELVVSTALYAQTSGSLLYTLSRDYKLRSWNSVTGSLLRTLDIRSSFPSSQELVIRGAHTSTASDTFLLPDITDVPLVQVVTHPSSTSRYSHLLVIFLATPLSTVSAGSFVVYRVTSGTTPDLVYAGHRECSMLSAGSNLKGFQITSPTSADHAGTGWRLAVVWEKRGLTYGETICADDIFQFATIYEQPNAAFLHDWHTVSTDHEIVEKMDTAYFDKLISLDPPNPTDPHDNIDIAQTFSQHLFYPGRFSTRDLETALADYLSQPGRQLSQLSAPSSTLSGRFETIVGCDLEMAIDPQTGAPVVDAYREAMKRDWLSIWARVRDLDKHSRYPLATTEVDGHVVIHTRAGISAYIPEDGCGMIDRSESDEGQIIVELPESAFTNAYPHLDAETRRSAITISSAGAYITTRLEEQESPEGTSTLEDLMEHIDSTLASAEVEPLESRCEALWEDLIEPHFGEDDQLSLRRIMSNTPHERDAISHTLDLLSSNNPIDEEISDRVFSGTGNTLLTSSISSTVRSRYALARKVLLVALYHLAEGSEEDEFEEVIAVVNRAFCVYHRYSVLRWMCEQTGNGRTRAKSTKSKREGEETALRSRHDLENDGTDPSYSLLHSLLASQSVKTPISGFSLLGDAAQSYLSKLDLVDDELVELEPRDQDVVLAHTILVDGHADTAGRLTELYPLSAGIAYVRARALVEVGAFEESVDLFKQGASGVRGEFNLVQMYTRMLMTDGSLACILPFTRDNGESEYYAHVSSLYGDAGYDGPAIHFGQLALRSSKSTPSKALYTRIFLSNIALGNYEDAYSILTATTSEEL
jgi:nuclear pore complex protein Nup160